MIRLTIPSIEEDDLAAVREVLASGLLVQGPRVAAFEEAVAAYVGTEYAVAVSNCTAALHLSLLALGIGRGDRVAVAAYSWPATANVVELCGAEPVFVDIDPENYNLSPQALEDVLRRVEVKAILPVHTFGGMADMPRIMELADRYRVPVVEDAACALGAEARGRRAGAWGVMGCFSFHPRKAITTGEGGIITTNDPSLDRTLRALRNHGLDPAAAVPDFILAGFNYRMTEFQGALGESQMRKLERVVNARRQAAAEYDALLRGSGVTPPTPLPESRHVYQSYVALLPSGAAPFRTDIIQTLRRRQVEATIGTYHIAMTSYFRRRQATEIGDFPITDDVSSRGITLPLSERLTGTEQIKVVTTLLETLEATAGIRC